MDVTRGQAVAPSGNGANQAIAAMTRRRWFVCGLLFFAATVNYLDRSVLALLKPTLQGQLGFSEIDYSNIVLCFQIAYGIGLLFLGKFIDWAGTKKGFAASVMVWSGASMAHAAAKSVFQFAAARIALGIGESGSFPASIKAVAEWFPKKERATATGIFNSGTNIGAIIAPILVAWCTVHFGWRSAFLWTGAFDILWLVLWFSLYRRPEQDKRCSPEELAYIRSDPPDPPMIIPMRKIASIRQGWAVAFGKIIADPVWYVYLFWIPDFLARNLHLDLKSMRLPLLIMYTGASVGSLAGGMLSSALIQRGWTPNASRKTAMLICALTVMPVALASYTKSLWVAVALVALAMGAHQGWSANVFTLASDMFPRNSIASVIGFATMVGTMSGIIVTKSVGYILQQTGSYRPVFIIAGSAYLISLLFIHLLAPRLEPAKLELSA